MPSRSRIRRATFGWGPTASTICWPAHAAYAQCPKTRRASCSLAAIVVEQSAETRPASNHVEHRVVVARRWLRPDDLAADPLVVALRQVVRHELLDQVPGLSFANMPSGRDRQRVGDGGDCPHARRAPRRVVGRASYPAARTAARVSVPTMAAAVAQSSTRRTVRTLAPM